METKPDTNAAPASCGRQLIGIAVLLFFLVGLTLLLWPRLLVVLFGGG